MELQKINKGYSTQTGVHIKLQLKLHVKVSLFKSEIMQAVGLETSQNSNRAVMRNEGKDRPEGERCLYCHPDIIT